MSVCTDACIQVLPGVVPGLPKKTWRLHAARVAAVAVPKSTLGTAVRPIGNRNLHPEFVQRAAARSCSCGSLWTNCTGKKANNGSTRHPNGLAPPRRPRGWARPVRRRCPGLTGCRTVRANRPFSAGFSVFSCAPGCVSRVFRTIQSTPWLLYGMSIRSSS